MKRYSSARLQNSVDGTESCWLRSPGICGERLRCLRKPACAQFPRRVWRPVTSLKISDSLATGEEHFAIGCTRSLEFRSTSCAAGFEIILPALFPRRDLGD